LTNYNIYDVHNSFYVAMLTIAYTYLNLIDMMRINLLYFIMIASYDIKDLIDACNMPVNVVVLRNALTSASIDFGLNTAKEVMEFISNDGIENPKLINTKKWENNPDEIPIYVDAYSFYSGKKHGYLAFMFSNKTKKWLIKSLKLNRDSLERSEIYNQLSDIYSVQQKLK
jgi:hypothetical protein